eukprot:gene2627-3257_t
MGNTNSFVKNQNNEKLSSFEIKKTPSFIEILDELKENTITEELLDSLFRKVCFMSVDQFFDDFPSKDALKCQHECRDIGGWFFSCRDCILADNTVICPKCFFNGDHVEKNHKFSLEVSTSANCDCGNPEAIKKEGFCSTHANVSEENRVKYNKNLPSFIQKDLHLFFRYLFSYLQRITSPTENTKNKEAVEIIISWITNLASQSSIFIHIIAEEMLAQTLDNDKFSLYDPVPVKFLEEQDFLESRHFLSYLFRRLALLEYFLQLFVLLIDNHRVFKVYFFEEYLKNYMEIFEPRDTMSSDYMVLIGSFYMENKSIIVPFSTGFSKYNLLDLILKTHIIYMPILEPFYKSNKKIEREVMLQSDLVTFNLLMKEEKVAKFYIDNEEIFPKLFELARALHRFTSPQLVDPAITTTRFLVGIEYILMDSVRSYNTSLIEDRESVAKKTIDEIIKNIKKLEYPPLFDRGGYLLPHDAFFKKFKYDEICVHFPLYRMLATILLEGNMHLIPYAIEKLSKENIVNMISTLFLFRVCYVSYDPTTKEVYHNGDDLCTDLTMMSDLFMLQLGIMMLGPKHFLFSFFNVISSIDLYNDTTAFNEVFALLISIIQIRATLTPTDEVLKYHLIQCVSTGCFQPKHYPSIKFFLKDTSKEKYDEICEEICDKNKDRFLKVEYENVDPYYPFYALKFRTQLKGYNREHIEKVYEKNGVDKGSYPLPPQLLPLDPNMKGVFSIFDDSNLTEMAFCILLEYVNPGFVGYVDAFELQQNLKLLMHKTDIIANDFLYILALSIKTFKEEVYPSMDEATKLLTHSTLESYFKCETNEAKLAFQFDRPLSVYNFIKPYDVEVDFNQRETLCVLDVLFRLWNSTVKEFLNLEKRHSLLYIFNFLKEFDPCFVDYFKSKDINTQENNDSEATNQAKLSKAEKFQKLAEQMKQQQQSFLNNPLFDEESDHEDTQQQTSENKDKPSADGAEEPKSNVDQSLESVTTSHQEDDLLSSMKNKLVDKEEVQVEEEDEEEEEEDPVVTATPTAAPATPTAAPATPEAKPKETPAAAHPEGAEHYENCIICKQGHSNEHPLYAVGYIDITSTIYQHMNQSIRSILKDIPPKYKEFLKLYYNSELIPGSLQYVPDERDPMYSYPTLFFYRSPSTYISSCNHNIHSDCLEGYRKEYYDGFYCPLCSRPSNLIIPLFFTSSPEFPKARHNFFKTLCKFDFFLYMKTWATSFVCPLYLWKFVLQNIETLELKSRQFTAYSTEPYYAIQQVEFEKELLTLKRIYKVIQSIDTIPQISDPDSLFKSNFSSLTDPFTVASYTYFITNKDPQVYCLKGFYLTLFYYFVYEFMLEEHKAGRPEPEINAEFLKAKFKQLQSNPFKKEDLERCEKYILPYLRKVMIFKTIFFESTLPVEKFMDIKFLSQYIYTSLETCIKEYDFTPHIVQYAEKQRTPNGTPIYGMFPPPASIDQYPTFINLPNNYVDFIKKKIFEGNCSHCKAILKTVCLFCSSSFCNSDKENCKGCVSVHTYHCPSTPISVFMDVNVPVARILKEELGRTSMEYSYDLYLTPDGHRSTTPASNLTLSQEQLKKLFQIYINSNNTREFSKK